MKEHGRASRLHKESIIIDALNVSDWQNPKVFSGLAKGGLTAVNATVAIWENFVETMDNIARWYPRFENYADTIIPVKSVADIMKAKKEGKCGIIFGFQNSSPIEDDLRRLCIFHELGVRVIQVTYNNSNLMGSGYLDPPEYGLTTLGRDFVSECNRLGILLDCSHVGYQTTLDTIEASKKPIALTHTGPRALCSHRRNHTDEELKALAAKGGVVGAVGVGTFTAKGNKITLSDFLDNIDYMVKLIGIDHVGVGLDFSEGYNRDWLRWLFTGRNIDREPHYQMEWPVVMPRGLETAAEWPNITEGLFLRGYSESETEKLIGGNFLRLFSEVWR